MIAYDMTKRQAARCDSALCKYLRVIMKGRASHRAGDDRYVAMSDDEMLRSWRLLHTLDELRLRRLKWYHKLATDPQLHSQVLAAFFATTRMERSRDVRRFGDDDDILPTSTLMARQLWGDVQALTVLEQCEWVRELRSPLQLFRVFREAFLAVDIDECRASFLATTVAPPGWAPTRAACEEGTWISSEEKRFVCDHRSDEEESCGVCVLLAAGCAHMNGASLQELGSHVGRYQRMSFLFHSRRLSVDSRTPCGAFCGAMRWVRWGAFFLGARSRRCRARAHLSHVRSGISYSSGASGPHSKPSSCAGVHSGTCRSRARWPCPAQPALLRADGSPPCSPRRRSRTRWATRARTRRSSP